MENQFVPYELAVKLKELGFDEPCIAGYRDFNGIKLMTRVNDSTFPIIENLGYGKYCHQNQHVVKAALWQQAFDWFRENHGLTFIIDLYKIFDLVMYLVKITDLSGFLSGGNAESIVVLYDLKTYKEARLACLKKLIGIVEKNTE